MTIDHLGKQFNTISTMCEYWNIPYKTFCKRYYTHKWPLERILTTPYKPTNCKDHLGNEFSSMEKMCQYWNIPFSTFDVRYKKYHWSLEDALTILVNSVKTFTDHKKNVYPCKNDCLKAYGIDRGTFKNRLRRGWSLQEALEAPIIDAGEICTDYLGNIFPNKKSMCEYHRINILTYHSRIRNGLSNKTALTMPMRKSINELLVTEYLYNKNLDFSAQFSKIIDNHRLRFDFYLENVGIIEVDGEQHFNIVTFGDNDYIKRRNNIALSVSYDIAKNKYCIKNNIALLRIPYWCIKDGSYKKMIDDFLINKTNSKYSMNNVNATSCKWNCLIDQLTDDLYGIYRDERGTLIC